MTVLYHDTFTGSGTLDGHTSDSGHAYEEGPADTLGHRWGFWEGPGYEFEGPDHLVLSSGTVYPDSDITLIGSWAANTFVTGVTVPSDELQLDVVYDFGDTGYTRGDVTFAFWLPADGAYGGYFLDVVDVYVEFSKFDEGGAYTNYIALALDSDPGVHTVSLRVHSDGSAAIYVDNVEKGSVPAGTITPPGSYDPRFLISSVWNTGSDATPPTAAHSGLQEVTLIGGGAAPPSAFWTERVGCTETF